MAPHDQRPTPSRRYAVTLAMTVLVWAALIGWLAYLLYARTYWLRESDEANLREWLDEARIHRKSLPELVSEYVALRTDHDTDAADEVVRKRQEIHEQLLRLADPTRLYPGQLPLFPEVYQLEVRFAKPGWAPIVWASPLPRPRPQLKATNELRYPILGAADSRATMHCEYRLHAFNARQREAEEAQQRLTWVVGIVLCAGLVATGWAYRVLQRERAREFARLQSEQLAEHAANEALRQENRAAAAERAALELKSQLFASIGIMAGSYAHNIKNLLVRPNDLLARCAAGNDLSTEQRSMLGEIRHTLGTVTERLQQILRTVRRDPAKSEATRIDLNKLLRELVCTWQELGRDKWKLQLRGELADGELPVAGDASHLTQALENLLFNARDATFEMRNRLRDEARQAPASDEQRRRSLLEAASWRGEVIVRGRRIGNRAVVEVEDNGIGMTDEVRQRCTETHFSTKRDNALFEGYNAGMGLGLSFVAMVLEHHGGTMEIDSKPGRGATIRVSFPLADR